MASFLTALGDSKEEILRRIKLEFRIEVGAIAMLAPRG